MNRKEKTMIIAIVIASFEVSLKFILASISGSLGMQAGAYHSLICVMVSVIVLLGLFVSRLEKKKLSQGINLTENILAIIISLFIFYAAYEIFIEAIAGADHEITNITITAIGAVISSLIMYFVARYKIYVGEKVSSPALTADGYHNKTHMYANIAILIGILGGGIGLSTLDKLAALFIVALVFSTGLEIFIGAVKALKTGTKIELKHELFVEFKGYLRNAQYIIIAIVILTYVLSGFFTVAYDEVGMVKRFGKVVRADIPPGLHYRFPYPFENVDRIKADNIRKIETGISLFLTGDENLLDVNLSVHYRISDPYTYQYKISDQENFVINIASSTLRQKISEKAIDFILTTGRKVLQKEILKEVQTVLDNEKAGMEIINAELIRVEPPANVITAFYDVSSAREDKVTYINEAKGYAEKILAEVLGEAQKRISEAIGYQKEKVNNASGETAGFLYRLREYQKSKDITETRLYLETMDKILKGRNKYILGEGVKTGSTDFWFLDENVKEKITTIGRQ